VDVAAIVAAVSNGGTCHILDLTPTEFSLLATLMRAPSVPFRDSICWSTAFLSEALERVVDTHIYNLRKKLEGRGIRRASQRSRRGLQVQTAMIKNHHSSLWRWICARILALAIGSVIVIATCMWLRYAVQNYWIMGKCRRRCKSFCAQPEPAGQPGALPQIVDTWWGLSYSTPSIASADWVTVALLVLVMIPFIVVMGLTHARPLQFSRLRDAAKDVAEGQFGRQAELIKDAPAEMVSFAADFNHDGATGPL
jgi:hypothetical protein